jgi:hypothetical protein
MTWSTGCVCHLNISNGLVRYFTPRRGGVASGKLWHDLDPRAMRSERSSGRCCERSRRDGIIRTSHGRNTDLVRFRCHSPDGQRLTGRQFMLAHSRT